MYHLRVPVFLLAVLVLLHCIAAAPNHRYFNPGSSDDEQENALPDKESRSLPELISNPFLGLSGARLQRQILTPDSHHLQKRKCVTSTCASQGLADKMAHLNKGKNKTDVGPYSFGKRDIHQPPAQLPF